VQKDGPTKGKQFYTCPKPRESQCGYFQWSDELDQFDGSGSSSHHSGRGAPGLLPPPKKSRNNFSNATKSVNNTGTATKRKCSVCKQEGEQDIVCSVYFTLCGN